MSRRRYGWSVAIAGVVPVLLVAFQNFSPSRAMVRTFHTISSKIKNPLIVCDPVRSEGARGSVQGCAIPAAKVVAINQFKLNDPRGAMACAPASYAMGFSVLDRTGYTATNASAAKQYPKLLNFHRLAPNEKALRLADQMETDAKSGTSAVQAFTVANGLARIYGKFSVIHQGVQWNGGPATTFRPSYLRYRMARSEVPVLHVSRYVMRTKTLISGKVAIGVSVQLGWDWGHVMLVKGFSAVTDAGKTDVDLVPDDSVRYVYQDPAVGLDSSKIIPLEAVPKNVYLTLPGDLTPATTFLLKERRLTSNGLIADTEKPGFYDGKALFPVIAIRYIQRSDVAIY